MGGGVGMRIFYALRKISKYAKDFFKYLIYAVFFLFVGVLAGLIPFFLISTVLSRFLSGAAVDTNLAVVVSVGIAICLILKTCCTNAGLIASHFLAYKTLQNMRERLAEKLLRMPMGTIIETGPGELKKSFLENVEDMELILAHALPEGLANLLSFLVVTGALFVVDWRMALLSLAVLPIGCIAFWGMLRTSKTRMQPYYQASKQMNEAIVEYISGMEVIKVFGQTSASFRKYGESVKRYRQQTLEWFGVSWSFMAVYSVFLPATLCFMLPLGAIFLLDGGIALNQFVLCCLMGVGVGFPMLRLVEFIPMLPQLSIKAEKLERIFDMQELEEGNIDDIPDHFDVECKDVSFSYGGNEVLHHISFCAKENMVTALVGESGAGKSTLAKLISRFWDVGAGSIQIGGIDIRSYSYHALASLMSYVSQDIFLFNTSILENIRMGRPGASDEEVIKIAKATQCHEFILNCPDGYHTIVGDGGEKLSGGQRQRVSIARAMLKNAPIIILDEATSFTDPENEDKIQRSLNNLIQGKTLIVIAHRLSTIQNANNIIVMDQGRIAAQGTHSELMNTSPLYQLMWETYTQSSQWNVRKGNTTVPERSEIEC